MRITIKKIKISIKEIAKILHEENPDLPHKFIIETSEAQSEIEQGLGEEYEFGIIK
ncbi:MAG: hypothetical protein H8E57_09165 [Candidatus Cloacimonetes bacterium]|nr:hypothetical protein [Candidatus Cloacimonadota bacterium]